MKKKLMIAVSAVLAPSAGIFAYLNSESKADDLFSANVEALASQESGGVYECYDRYKLYVSHGTLTNVRTCDICGYQQVYRPRTKSVCPR